MKTAVRFHALACALVVGCQESPTPTRDAATAADAKPNDAASTDAPARDAEEAREDATAAPDAGFEDASIPEVGAPDATPNPSCTHCRGHVQPVERGTLPAGLNEISGIAASKDHPGILYGHNDSGDSARVFAFQGDGSLVAEIALDGVDADDFEDIAVGPCPSGSCVYVGDIGDNSSNRLVKVIYRFPEPTFSSETSLQVSNVESFRFRYPGVFNLENAETLMVHPQTGDVYVVSKEDSGTPSDVYKFPMPLDQGGTATLQKVATLPIPSSDDPDLSGGDIHPCGDMLLFRIGNAKVVRLTVDPGFAFDEIFNPNHQTIDELPNPVEGNAEAITWSADGLGYYTSSEGAGSELHYTGCGD